MRERERERGGKFKKKNKVIQRDEFNVKESRRHIVSVLMNLHQDSERIK